MFNRKNLVLVSMLFVLMISLPLMAAEKGTARFSVPKVLYAAGVEIPAGKYDVKYESEGDVVKVVFALVGKPKGIELQGKFEQVAEKYKDNSIGMGKDASDRLAIKHLQLKGKSMRITFE